RGEELVVAQDEIPQTVEVVDVVGGLRRRSGVLGRQDGEALRQLVEKWVPREAPWTVEKYERGPAALGLHADPHLAVPDCDRSLAHAWPPAAMRVRPRRRQPPAASPRRVDAPATSD